MGYPQEYVSKQSNYSYLMGYPQEHVSKQSNYSYLMGYLQEYVSKQFNYSYLMVYPQEYVRLSVLLPLDRHLCWWTISHREYHPSSSQCFYPWIETSAGGLLVTESIIRPVVNVSITRSTPLLLDC